MSSRSERINQMDPSQFVSHIKEFTQSRYSDLDEVFIRRSISSLYFALFNFWANKKYLLENRRGRGPNQDCFNFIEFIKEMIAKDLDVEIRFLHTYRTASDHYALNPTIVKHEGQAEDIFGCREEVNIDKSSLKKAIHSAESILHVLLEE